MTHPDLAHRAVAALPTDLALVDGEALGGATAIATIAERLYDGIEADRSLRTKFGSDFEGERQKLGAFLVELFGGAPEWNAKFARQDLGGAHRFIHITAADAGRWLGHLRQAVIEVTGDETAAKAVVEALRPVADALVNETEPAERGALREARYQPTRDAVVLCARGDTRALLDLLDEHPHLTSPVDPGSAELVCAAATKGRVDVLQTLLARGADVNKPGRTPYGLMVTPLCAARAARKRSAVDALTAAGAVDDIFTWAFLGDVDALRQAFATDPTLANEPDPASDFARATVVDHAVHGAAPVESLLVLAAHGARAPAHGHHLLGAAAGAGRTEVVRLLLDLGADARFVTAGRWILDDECAALLLGAGADVNHAPTRWDSWIWRSCTGNRGRREDPQYVDALLRAGADVHARAFDKTALHFAAKAGFRGITAVLLAAGADSNAVDGEGLTPLWHLLKSGARTDRAEIARLLLDAGADPTVVDTKGRKLVDVVAADRRRPAQERRSLLALL